MRFLPLIAATLTVLSTAALAEGTKSYSVKGTIDQAAFDLESAIIDRGLTIDMKGNVGGMLQRTGKDVGATQEVYQGAYYFTFCSAVLSRKMMEADPATMGLCPYSVFAYETKANPGEVVIGYRRTSGDGSDAAKPVLEEIDAWLDGIVSAAAGK